MQARKDNIQGNEENRKQGIKRKHKRQQKAHWNKLKKQINK